MKRPLKIIAVGEVLWDMLPNGKQLGGAPANFAFYCNQLGVNTQLISAVGKDTLGEELLDNYPYDTSLIIRNSKPTSQVDVDLQDGIPSYNIRKEVTWDYLEMTTNIGEALKNCDAIYYGTLAQRSKTSKATIHQMLDSVPKDCLKVFDVNLRQNYYSKELLEECLEKADVFKINEEELEILSDLFSIDGLDIFQVRKIMKTFNIEYGAYTKGSEGSYFIREKGMHSETNFEPILKVEVEDTIGAGDSFFAGLITSVLQKHSLKKAHQTANKISSFVCSQKGAMTPLKNKTI